MAIGSRFAVRAQTAWLGWPPALEDELLQWMEDNRAATRSGDRSRTAEVAQRFDAGEHVLLNWTAANRDPRMFGAPETFDPVSNAPYNLVYGIGKHVCHGRPLATLELRVLVGAVLGDTAAIEPDPDRPRERELPPLGGFAAAPLRLR